MNRMQPFLIILVLSILGAALCSPFDDGKYKPRTYDEYDDGKYYRPLDEGKYIPGDEGRYTYIYTHGNWPFDGTYLHRVGSNPDDADDPYMGYRVYASRYPYIHGVIKGLVKKYVSSNNINFGEATEGSTNHYSKVYADKEVAVKCTYLKPEFNGTEFTTQYPPQPNLNKGEKLGSFYSFKGSKVLSTVSNALTNKLKLEYEVFVRIVDDVSSPTKTDPITPKSEELISPLIILRPPKSTKVESSTSNHIKNSINEIVKSLIIDDVLPTVNDVQSSTDNNLKLTIGDVQLLPNDDVKPTIGYTHNLKDDDKVKPSTGDVTTIPLDDVMPIINNIKSLNDIDVTPKIADVTTVTYDDVRPTMNNVTTVNYNIGTTINDITTIIYDDVMPTSGEITTITYDEVRTTTGEVHSLSDEKVNVTTSVVQSTTKAGKR